MDSLLQKILLLLISPPLGILAGHFAIYAFNTLPAKWFCDVGEEPGEKLVSQGNKRIRSHPWKWTLSMFFTAALMKWLLEDWQWALPALAAIWIIVEIILSDKQYMIIPDQFLLLLLLTGFGFVPYYDTLWTPFLGLGAGLLPMLLIYGTGKLLFRKDIMGFGDVKFMAAIGFLTGPYGVLFTFVVGFISSGIFFGIGILLRKIHLKDEEPLGPFLGAAAILFLIFYKDLHMYLNIV